MSLQIFGSPENAAIPVGYIYEEPVVIKVPEAKAEVPKVEVKVEKFPWEKYIPWALAALVIMSA